MCQKITTLWAKDDMRIVARYQDEFCLHVAEGWFDNDAEFKQFVNRVDEYGVYSLTLQKWIPEVGIGWDYIDGLIGNVPDEDYSLMDIAREQFAEFGDFKEEE
tara:strand:+ start:573 stop:881 length:309 start_codon:yes stop_codon:yes gene_type:complete